MPQPRSKPTKPSRSTRSQSSKPSQSTKSAKPSKSTKGAGTARSGGGSGSRGAGTARSGGGSGSRGAARRAPSRGAPRSTTQAESPTPPAEAAGGLRDVLVRSVLTPLNAVMLSAERIQEAMDDAVERGRMTRDDANELVLELVRTGRKQTEDLLVELEQLVTSARGSVEWAASEAGTRARKAPGGDRIVRRVDRARRVAGLGSPFPILGYDDLTARQVTERLGGLTPAELRKARDHERRHANRKSVLTAIERRLS